MIIKTKDNKKARIFRLCISCSAKFYREGRAIHFYRYDNVNDKCDAGGCSAQSRDLYSTIPT